MAELKITAANFENEVLHSDKPVLLDFYADWCGPCKMLSPILHELAEEKSGALKVGKINVDEQMEHTVGYLCHAFLHFSQVFQGKGRKIVVGSQIDQHRPPVGRCLGLIVFVTGRQQKGKQKKGEQEPMFHRRILH